jgi:dephospho-CoA kinase
MTKIIGLTGGIGSGKTTVANYFQELGVPVYIADDHAKVVMQLPEIISEIKAVFGESVFENGTLNRKKMAEIVFNSPEKLKQLNAIVHPAVKNDFEQWISNHKKNHFILYEAAILFESERYRDCDAIITVTAPLETRIERVIKRDNTSRELVLQRINSQWTDEQRIAKSDFVIDNRTIEEVKKEVVKILKILNL